MSTQRTPADDHVEAPIPLFGEAMAASSKGVPITKDTVIKFNEDSFDKKLADELVEAAKEAHNIRGAIDGAGKAIDVQRAKDMANAIKPDADDHFVHPLMQTENRQELQFRPRSTAAVLATIIPGTGMTVGGAIRMLPMVQSLVAQVACTEDIPESLIRTAAEIDKVLAGPNGAASAFDLRPKSCEIVGDPVLHAKAMLEAQAREKGIVLGQTPPTIKDVLDKIEAMVEGGGPYQGIVHEIVKDLQKIVPNVDDVIVAADQFDADRMSRHNDIANAFEEGNAAAAEEIARLKQSIEEMAVELLDMGAALNTSRAIARDAFDRGEKNGAASQQWLHEHEALYRIVGRRLSAWWKRWVPNNLMRRGR